MENGAFAPQKVLWEMEHLLQKSKCSIFHNIFKYMIFQRALLWSKGLKSYPTDWILKYMLDFHIGPKTWLSDNYLGGSISHTIYRGKFHI